MSATFLGSYTATHDLPAREEPKVAFLGRSNVGKSSLINLLTGTSIARVSKTPGRTQTLNLFEVDGRWVFGDFPGYGYARVSKGQRKEFESLITRFLTVNYFQLAVQIVDARHPATVMDVELHEWVNDQELSSIIVLNKSDKLNQKERARAEQETSQIFGGQPIIFASSSTKEGKRELMKILTALET